MYSIGHTIGNSRSNSLGVPTLAWLPLDDKCSTGSIVGHAPCLPDPPYLCLSFVKSQQKKYLYLYWDFFWFQISILICIFSIYPLIFFFFKNEDCILIFISNCSCIFIWILPCKPLCLPFVETSHYCISLYFDLDSCHAPCQTLPIYAFHLSKPAKSIAPVLIKQFPNPHYP